MKTLFKTFILIILFSTNVLAEEWEAMGLSTDISTAHFGDTKLVNKIKKNNRKMSLAI